MDDASRNRSIGELLGDLSRDTARLVRQQLELARLEIGAIVSRAARQTLWIVAGALLCVAAVFGFLAAAILALIATGMPPALSTLLVSAAALAAGGILVAFGVSALRHLQFEPVQTLETLRHTATWVREGERSHG